MGATASQARDVPQRGEPWLVRRREEWRQRGIVGLYDALLVVPVFVPAARHPLVFLAACDFSF